MAEAEAELERFIDRYSEATAALARALLARMRARLPGVTMLVYDNYNALAIGFAPDEKPSHAALSLALYPKWVSLFFLNGAGLPDPHRLLAGRGSKVRHIRMASAEMLDDPRIERLIAEAVARAEPPFDPAAAQRLLIKSVSAKQRPRR